MPRFVVEFKLKGRPNRDRPSVTVQGERAVLGSRPLADVYVKDRMVAQEAVAFDFDGSRLRVEVLAELAGVFVDGRPIEGTGPLAHGGVLQAGHTMVEVAIDAEQQVCTLTTHEQYLPTVVDGVVKKAKPERPFALVDPGPQEHLWGRNPVLRRATWSALALGALALLAFPILRDTEAVTRGELAAHHRPGASDRAPDECADCHAPFSSDYAPRCATCHEGLDSTDFHPYGAVATTTCSQCHMDHQGADHDLIPASAREDDPATGWKRLCLDCHGVLEPGTRDAPVRDCAGVATDRWLHVDGFSHKDHRVAGGRPATAAVAVPPDSGQVPVSCATCHVPHAAGALRSSVESAEFALVTYEQCLACHAGWSVPVHGRDRDGAACLACHAQAATPAEITADLRQVTLPATGSRWSVPARRHDWDKDECTRCHVVPRPRSDQPPARVEKVFRHDHHLRSVQVPPGTGLVYSEQCVACHGSVAGSDSLAGTPLVDTDVCASCHTDGAPEPVAAAGTRTVTDMFHRVHTLDPGSIAVGATRSLAQREKLVAGCVACHAPVEGEERMGFRAGTQDCSACHTRHANVGQGRCVLCHVDRGYEGNRRPDGRLDFVFQEEGIFAREKAVVKTTAAIAAFDHGSPGHAGRACAECHDEAAVDPAERVLDVPWPAVDEASCVACHALERYHR